MTEDPNSKYLDAVINCVRQVGTKEPKKHESLDNLYGEADELVKNFENNINRCKRYNQAKINRKYQMIITEMQGQLKKINEKLKIQQGARSPTKRHVTDLLDQLINFKQENDLLKKQLTEAKTLIVSLTNKNEIQGYAIKKLQNTQPKAMVERLPSLSSGTSVSEAIKEYLKDKEKVRAIVENSEKSNLQKFLHYNVPKSWNWTLGNLLQQLDKWADGIKQSKKVDMWKIRSSVAKSFSQYLDDSTSLTQPASFKGTLTPISSVPKSFGRKSSRFSSVYGEKRENSFIDSSFH